MELVTVNEDNEKPIYSCPNCYSEDINLNPPSCNNCGADDSDHPKAVQWMQCPECEKRDITVHGTSQTNESEFRLTCNSCDYDVELIWI